jgi:hypothetical protein
VPRRARSAIGFQPLGRQPESATARLVGAHLLVPAGDVEEVVEALREDRGHWVPHRDAVARAWLQHGAEEAVGLCSAGKRTAGWGGGANL